MKQIVKKGSWVEIHRVILTPQERAPQVPDDTKRVPLEMRVKGFLASDAKIGDEVTILTAAGRTVTGRLVEVNPAYTHGFGPPVPELTPIGREVRQIVAKVGTGEEK
jgi:hypothetical protein